MKNYEYKNEIKNLMKHSLQFYICLCMDIFRMMSLERLQGCSNRTLNPPTMVLKANPIEDKYKYKRTNTKINTNPIEH